MSTIRKVVSTTMKAVRMKPHVPGVTWSSDSPGRNDGEGAGEGVVARAMRKWCTVQTFCGGWLSRDSCANHVLRVIEVADIPILAPQRGPFQAARTGSWT